MIVDCWVKYKAVSEDGGVQNLLMLQMLIEMMKDTILVVFWDMEKA